MQGIEDKSTVNPYRTKANIMLNGGMEGVEAEEEEEEEEEETSLGSPVMSSPAHHAEEEHHPPHHLQEMHPSQFPMSGDLPTLDHGMPSPTLGFDLSSCSEVSSHLSTEICSMPKATVYIHGHTVGIVLLCEYQITCCRLIIKQLVLLVQLISFHTILY